MVMRPDIHCDQAHTLGRETDITWEAKKTTDQYCNRPGIEPLMIYIRLVPSAESDASLNCM